MDLQSGNELLTPGGMITVGEAAARFTSWAEQARLKPGEKFALVTEEPIALMSALTHFFKTGLEGFLTTPSRFDPILAEEVSAAGFAIVDGQGRRLGGGRGMNEGYTQRICLQTTGTTGRPKMITHSHATLMTIDPNRTYPEQRWLVPYLPGTYAWYQLATLALFSPGQHLILPPTGSPGTMWDFAADHDCTAVSSTPSFWRSLFLERGGEALARIPPRQITLGGEPVDQPLLDTLHALFPQAQLTHIYASTESGAAIVVHDRREGFPLDWLNRPKPGRPTLRLQNGRLWIKSPFAAPDLSAWHDTGDRVEIRGDRAVVVGRTNPNVINVGGQKVDALRVAEVIRRDPRVLWCRVFARPAPVIGMLVAADVVLAPEWDGTDHEAALTRFCREQGLPGWMIPRLWTRCHEIPLSANFKTSPLTHA